MTCDDASISAQVREGAAAGEEGGFFQFLLDAQQLVVLLDAVDAGGRARS